MTNERTASTQPLGPDQGVSPFLPAGTEIAGYRIESFVNHGGMGFVYEATDVRLDRRVALKVLTPELASTEEFRERFLRESRFAAALDHPSIVPIYEAGEAGGLLYIAMRYVPGSDLSVLLRQGGRLEPSRTLALLSPVAEALDAAHAAGLVHRDVKPANILVASTPGREARAQVYLTDFGLTKRVAARSTLTATGHLMGTSDYVAPEQLEGKPADARTDLYAFGCVAYQCLTGRPPFVCDDPAALLWAHLHQPAAPVSSHRGELSAVDPVMAKALAKDPDDRYQTCGQFITALADTLGLDPRLVSAAATAPLGNAAQVKTQSLQAAAEPRRRRSWRIPAAVAAAAAVALLAVLATGAVSSGAGPKPSTASVTAAATDPLGRAAITAADTTLRAAKQVDAALRAHTDVMNRLDSGQLTADQAHNLGMPSLVNGAAASTQFNQTLNGYQQAATKYRAATAAGTPNCTLALAAADTTFRAASQVDAALRAHTDVMNRLDSGQLTADQAHNLGMPSLVNGAAASTQFTQTLNGYQQAATKCR